MKNSILILSGGMDSVTMLYDKQDQIAMAVSFDYGSNHNAKEIPLAKKHCQRLGIQHIVIKLDFMKEVLDSSLLSGSDDIPEGDYDDENIRSTVVPFRNGIMLSIAAAIAENNNLSHIMMANHGGDHTVYPDCRPEFVRAMSEAARCGTFNGVTLDAPYTDITKAEIAGIGKRLGLDYSETWSCYKGLDKQCGRCATCKERKAALAAAGINDTTEYEV